MFEVQSNYGGALFKEKDDAISALFLLAPYHNIEIDQDVVRKDLDKNGIYTNFSLSVKRMPVSRR